MKGIIKQAITERERLQPGYSIGRRSTSEKTERQNARILDLSMLKDYVTKVLDFMSIDNREEHDDKRKWTYLWEVPVQNILGFVDEPTWVFMIEKQANWCIDNRDAVQPNGRWHVFAHEVDMITRHEVRKRTVGKDASGRPEVMEIEKPVEFLQVGIQLVDLNGERDLQYDMGRPTTKKESFDPQLLKAMMKNAPKSTAGEYESKIEEQDKRLADQSDMIQKLQTENQKTNELMAALLSELQDLKGQRKLVSRSTTRKKSNAKE